MTSPVTPRPWLAVRMLVWREIIRFFRQRNRVIGALGQPIIFWLLFGAGLHRTFRLPGMGEDGPSFFQYYLPGTLVLVLLFTAIFATISIIEDRREGFLQSVLVAPVPRWAMVLGKIVGGATIAVIQGLLFLLLALSIGWRPGLLDFAGVVLLTAVISLGLTALGLMIAWRMESTQGFHAIMNLALMPMWLLSGAFFPAPEITPGTPVGQIVLHWTMRLNPLTYSVSALRTLLSEQSGGFWAPTASVSWTITLVAMLLAFFGAWAVAGGRTQGDMQ